MRFLVAFFLVAFFLAFFLRAAMRRTPFSEDLIGLCLEGQIQDPCRTRFHVFSPPVRARRGPFDVSARPHLVFHCPLEREKVGVFDVELVEEFLRAFSQSSGVCVHVNVPYGSNAHHTIEAVFKALGRAMAEAVRIDPRVTGVPSTKGVLG